MIEQFIQQAVSQLGANQNDVEEATSGLLSILQTQSNGNDFSALLSQIGGAEELMNKFEAGTNMEAQSGGGLMGSLLGAAGSMLGGNAGNMLGMAGLLSQIKMDSGQLGSLASMFFTFIQSEAGETLATNLMGSIGDFLSDKAA